VPTYTFQCQTSAINETAPGSSTTLQLTVGGFDPSTLPATVSLLYGFTTPLSQPPSIAASFTVM